MRRREFITLLGGAAAWPVAARAQQSAMPVIGFLDNSSPDPSFRAAFIEGLSQTGYNDGRNVAIEYRWAEGHNERLPALAADLVRRQVRVIATVNTPSVLAAKAATQTIPIIFGVGVDPVETGLVASLNRPGGNLTGVTQLSAELAAKRLELLHELVPTATSIALVVNPTNSLFTDTETRQVRNAARVLDVQLVVLNAASQDDIDGTFATLAQQRISAVLVSADAFFVTQRDQFVALAARYAIPAIYQRREFAVAGGLISYGPRLSEAYTLVGAYAGRILNGDKPSDLPVQQSARIETILNLKTARALGIDVPLSTRMRVDEVIE
jgi:putative tryptophan/tyrosine transport system substrate-binding protein